MRKRCAGPTRNETGKRLDEHNHKKTPLTGKGIPKTLIHINRHAALSDTRNREKFLMGWDNYMKSRLVR